MGEPPAGPAEAFNEGEPSTPRPAGSVILLRRGGRHGERALEVLMLQRSHEAAFMPRAWVFPGGSVDPADGEGEAGMRACAVRELEEEAGIRLEPGAELVLFSRWITPEFVKTRFDAWFFLALAPPHAPPEPDGAEIVDAAWYPPRAALDANAADELHLAFPTVKQLEKLLAFASSEEAIEASRGVDVEPVLPKLVGGAEETRLVLPGDPGYPA
jgi:8-oxo-dGTP pyrophosphatase MutT (NUDIX family)